MNTENSRKTKYQKLKDEKWNKMFVSRKVITSKAFLSLKTAAACQVYLIFLTKRVMKEELTGWVIKNNGEIQFTYNEAQEKWNISNGRFKRAIEMLVEAGFIDIAKTSSGVKKDVTLYAISDRWEKYGSDEFIQTSRPKRNEQLGFKKGNKHGKNSK